MNEVALLGCRTTPLMSYLKALGVLRHVAREDPGARLWWDPRGHAMLRTTFDEDGLVSFFLERYEPSPVTSPWNGASGYHAVGQPAAARALAKVERSDDSRLARMREAIEHGRQIVAAFPPRPPQQPAAALNAWVKQTKPALIERWRATAGDDVLEWVDAALALTVNEGPLMNPLLGSGGNDGKLEFSKIFLEQIAECLPGAFGMDSELPASRQRLLLSLLGEGAPRLNQSSVGMTNPGGAGLPNSSSSAGEGSLLNGWDFVLMMEGVLLFGGSVSRRLSGALASFSFTFGLRGVTRVGRSLGGESDADARGETWLPIWRGGATVASVARVLAEGRLQDGLGQATSGRTGARAATALGVERGIESFERIVFAQRFGSSNYIAVPAGQVKVAARPETMELLRGADRWLASVRRIDAASVRHGVAAVEASEAQVVARGVGVDRWLLALAELERSVARRPRSREAQSGVRPLGALDAQIVHRIDDGSAEQAIARALAGIGRTPEPASSPSAEKPIPSVRSLLEPVQPDYGYGFRWAGDRGLGRGISVNDPVGALVALAVACADRPATPGQFGCPLWAVQRFLDRETDDAAIVRLAFAFSLCAPARGAQSQRPDGYTDRLYALTRLVTGIARDPSDDAQPAPQVASALAAGRDAAAARTAFRRLTADGRAPLAPLVALRRSPADARRIAAALAIPLTSDATRETERLVLAPPINALPPPSQGVER